MGEEDLLLQGRRGRWFRCRGKQLRCRRVRCRQNGRGSWSVHKIGFSRNKVTPA